jgi:RNA polymerase subunit RPABC4/transcription elongation factor Spt4
MKKVCVVCGILVDIDTKECPNCGSYNFIPETGLQETDIRLRRLK